MEGSFPDVKDEKYTATYSVRIISSMEQLGTTPDSWEVGIKPQIIYLFFCMSSVCKKRPCKQIFELVRHVGAYATL